MALNNAWMSPVVMNRHALPALLHPMPMDNPHRIDDVSNEGPFATHDEFLACPPKACHNLRNDDIEKSMPRWTIKDPMDPITLHKPYPEIWLVAAANKALKPSRSLQTNRHTNPLDPKYKLPAGDSPMPCGNSDFFSNRVGNPMDCSDIDGARPESYPKRPLRESSSGECQIDPRTRPAKLTHRRERNKIGGCLELFDMSIGKKSYGFIRYPQSNPCEPIYPTEPHETPHMKYKRLKKAILPPHPKEKANVAERILDSMYWRSEQLPDVCRRYGDLNSGCVDYEGLRKSLEVFGLNFNDKDYATLLRLADKEGRGLINARDFGAQLRHNDGESEPSKRGPMPSDDFSDDLGSATYYQLERLELDEAHKLGTGLGVNWGHAKYAGQKPTNMGQGCAVIIEEKPHGVKNIVWADNEQKYNPFTGEMLPYQQPAMMSTGNSFQYNLNEVQAALSMKDKEKNYYIPGPYLPRGSIPVTHSCALSKACTLPHVSMEGNAHNHPEGAHHDHTQKFSPEPRGSRILQPDHLHQALNPVIEARPQKVSFQAPLPVEMGGRASMLDTAKAVGAAMRKASLEGRKLSEGFIKLPSLTGINSVPIPINNAKGDEVLWRRVEPPHLKQPYTTYKERVKGLHRSADIEAVRSLILP